MNKEKQPVLKCDLSFEPEYVFKTAVICVGVKAGTRRSFIWFVLCEVLSHYYRDSVLRLNLNLFFFS